MVSIEWVLAVKEGSKMKGIIREGKLIVKDGHTDAASVVRMCKTIISHAQMIVDHLDNPEADLPTWFTNKIAVSEYEVVSAANYINDGDMDHHQDG